MGRPDWSQPCPVCGRKPDTQPWPHQGFLCGHCDRYSMQDQGAPDHVLALCGPPDQNQPRLWGDPQ